MPVFLVDEGAKLRSKIFPALVVVSLRFLDEEMVILVFVRFIGSGIVIEV